MPILQKFSTTRVYREFLQKRPRKLSHCHTIRQAVWHEPSHTVRTSDLRRGCLPLPVKPGIDPSLVRLYGAICKMRRNHGSTIRLPLDGI